MDEEAVNPRAALLKPDVPSPVNRKTPPVANRGYSVESVMVDRVLVQKVKSLDLNTMFVRSSSRSKPLGANVTGS
jgi:hypothetical protein